MKNLKGFFNYIKESAESSVEIDKEQVREMLLPLNDMGISYDLKDGVIVSDDDNHGKKFLSVTIRLESLNKTELITTYKSNRIDDDRFWELLDEVLAFRGRVLATGISNIMFELNSTSSYPYMSLILIGDKDDSSKSRMDLIELERRITAKLNSMKSDFSYGTYARLHDDHIFIKSDGSSYTDRKFNNLMSNSILGSNLDINDFNIEKTRTGDIVSDYLIKITSKK